MNTTNSSKSLFGAEAKRAEALARLPYVNPFLPARTELEREVLQDRAASDASAWNVDFRRFGGDSPNVVALGALADRFIGRARSSYLAGRGTQQERDAYRAIVYFAIYHRHLDAFDAAIERAMASPQQPARLPIARKVIAELRENLGTLEAVEGVEAAGHVLALCFQLRRAFHNIFRFFIGTSAAATRLRARIWQSVFTHDLLRYQRTLFDRMREVSTLVTGPSGSGKEVVARAIALSQYLPFDEKTGTFPPLASLFMPVNVAALSQALIESELFGHRKGAFTGALQDRRGYFEICGPHGAVFLDEIGETPQEVQVKLLRVLQERRFQPVGDTAECTFDGKIIAATNRDLLAEIEMGRFRRDLYYRLCSDVVETPALATVVREDPDELRRLVSHVAGKLVGESEAPRLTDEVMAWSRAHPGYDWPGNFRELEQAVKNILVHGDYVAATTRVKVAGSALLQGDIIPAEEILRRYTREVYERIRNYSEAARLLHLDRRTVRKYAHSD